METAFQVMLMVLIPALPITAGVAVFRGGDKWKMFGATLVVLGLALLCTLIFVTPISTSAVTISFLES
jgi:cytochrome b561